MARRARGSRRRAERLGAMASRAEPDPRVWLSRARVAAPGNFYGRTCFHHADDVPHDPRGLILELVAEPLVRHRLELRLHVEVAALAVRRGLMRATRRTKCDSCTRFPPLHIFYLRRSSSLMTHQVERFFPAAVLVCEKNSDRPGADRCGVRCFRFGTDQIRNREKRGFATRLFYIVQNDESGTVFFSRLSRFATSGAGWPAALAAFAAATFSLVPRWHFTPTVRGWPRHCSAPRSTCHPLTWPPSSPLPSRSARRFPSAEPRSSRRRPSPRRWSAPPRAPRSPRVRSYSKLAPRASSVPRAEPDPSCPPLPAPRLAVEKAAVVAAVTVAAAPAANASELGEVRLSARARAPRGNHPRSPAPRRTPRSSSRVHQRPRPRSQPP